MNFLKKYRGGGGLSCRDIITYQVLKNQGFDKIYMTGCPAWYDLDHIDICDVKGTNESPKTIIVSDPAMEVNQRSCLSILDYMTSRFPEAKIVFAFHRDCSKDFRASIESRKIETIDISGSSDGFRIYDSCDMHVGYRVHAHIYNLSIRNKSILIEEDGRGAGVDQALGLPQIKAYDDFLQSGNDFVGKVYRHMPFYLNSELVHQLETYIDILEATSYQYLKNAFKLQQTYYDSMISFIKNTIT